MPTVVLREKYSQMSIFFQPFTAYEGGPWKQKGKNLSSQLQSLQLYSLKPPLHPGKVKDQGRSSATTWLRNSSRECGTQMAALQYIGKVKSVVSSCLQWNTPEWKTFSFSDIISLCESRECEPKNIYWKNQQQRQSLCPNLRPITCSFFATCSCTPFPGQGSPGGKDSHSLALACEREQVSASASGQWLGAKRQHYLKGRGEWAVFKANGKAGTGHCINIAWFFFQGHVNQDWL